MKKFHHYYLVAALFCTAGLFSCDSKDADKKETAPAFDMTAAKASINQSNKALGEELAKGDSAAVAAHYTADAKILPNGGPVIAGTENIKSMWGGLFRSGLNLQITLADAWGNNELITEEGTYVLSDKNGAALEKGKYIVLWKNEGGTWKMFRDIWNSDAPPPPAAK